MPFEARHLRVALPCGEVTRIATPEDLYWTDPNPGCDFGPTSLPRGCPGWAITVHCWNITHYAAGIVVSGDDLDALKIHLRARLSDIEKAQRAVENKLKS